VTAATPAAIAYLRAAAITAATEMPSMSRINRDRCGNILSGAQDDIQYASSSALQPGDCHACNSKALEPTNPIVNDSLLVMTRPLPRMSVTHNAADHPYGI
jgi:hypothetical protein